MLTVLSAYGFTIYEFRGKKLLFLLCLSTMMIPAELLIIQNFITISKLGWMDTFQGIILPTVASGFYIYMMREYFMQIPPSSTKRPRWTAAATGATSGKS